MKVEIQNSVKKYINFTFLISFIAILAILQGCSSDTSSDSATKSNDVKAEENKVPTVLNYGYIGTSELNLPPNAVGWGIEKGIIQEELKKYGIDEIKLTAFPNGPDLNESLISGRLDVGNLGDTPAILAKSSGADTRLISQPTTHNIGYLIAKKDGPKTIKDLEGKTIAIQKGSFMHRYIVGLLKQEGVENYNLIHMLTPDGQAALERGEIDAMTNSGTNALKSIEAGFVHLDDALSHPDLIGTSVTVITGEYLKKASDFPDIWNAAVKKSLDDLKQHEEEYYELVAKISNSTPESVKETAPIEWIEAEAFTDEGLKLLDGTKAFLIEEKLAQKDFDLDEWIVE